MFCNMSLLSEEFENKWERKGFDFSSWIERIRPSPDLLINIILAVLIYPLYFCHWSKI